MRPMFALALIAGGGYLLYRQMDSQPPRETAPASSGGGTPPPAPASGMPLNVRTAILARMQQHPGYTFSGTETYDGINFFYQQAFGEYARPIDETGLTRDARLTLDQWWGAASGGAGLGGVGTRLRRIRR